MVYPRLQWDCYFLMRPQHLTILPPLGGVVESTAYQSQPPYTMYDGSNCWPKDSAYRDRLSTRPAVRNYVTGGNATAGTTGAVRLLSEINYSTTTETTRYLIAGAGGSLWKLASASSGWEAIILHSGLARRILSKPLHLATSYILRTGNLSPRPIAALLGSLESTKSLAQRG